MTDLILPNIANSFNQGYDRGQQQQFNALAGRYIGSGGNDAADFQQAAAINPGAALGLQSGVTDAQNQHLQKIAGAANYVLNAYKSGNDAQTQGAYQAVRPYLAQLGAATGQVPPDKFTEDMLPNLYQIIAQSGGTPYEGPKVLAPGSELVGAGGNVLHSTPFADKILGNQAIGPNGERGTIAVNPGAHGAGQIVSLGGASPAGGLASPDFYNAVNDLTGQYGGTITSGVRSPEHNAEVGGVPNSQHLTGTAADVVIPADQKAAFIADAKAKGLQPIDEGDHVHLQNPQGGAGVTGVRLAVGTPTAKQPPSAQQKIAALRSLGATDEQIKTSLLGATASGLGADAGLSDDALQNAAWDYALNDKLPPVGRGNQGQAQRTAVMNATADLAKEYGVSPQELATTAGRNKAFQQSLNNTQKQTDTVDRASETFHQNADLMQSLADQVNAQGPQAWNQFVIGVKNKVTTDPTVAAYLAAQQTASQEYAKVASGATGAAGSTDSAREHANQVINAFQTPDQLRAVLGTLRQDTENQRGVAHSKLQELRTNMQQFGTSQTPTPSTPAPKPPAGQPDHSDLWGG